MLYCDHNVIIMKAKIVKVGNSRGLRLPKPILEEYGIEDMVELELKDGGIEIRPIRKPRENWSSAFREMHVNNDDELLIPDVFDDEDL